MAGPFGPGLAPMLGVEEGSLPTGYGGAPMLLTLVEALGHRGHQLTLITTDEDLFRIRSGTARFEGNGVTVYFCPRRPRAYNFNGRLPGRIIDLFAYERREIARVIASVPADVVHAHWTYEFALAALAAGKPTLVTAHDVASKVLLFAQTAYLAGRWLMQRMVLKQATWLSAVSPVLKDDLERISAAAITVVPNPLDERFFAAARTGTDPGRFCMILNNWSNWKNPKPVIQAWKIVRARAPTAVLHCYGGPFGAGGPVEHWAKRHGLADGIHFHGSKPYAEIADALRRCEALINPSRYETFGMVVAEAMALGVPVLVGEDSGALRWLAQDGRCGGIVDMSDPEAIAGLVILQMEGKAVTPAMSSAAQARIRGIASPAKVAQAYESLYARIVAGEFAGKPC